MLFAIKNIEELEKLEELASFKNQVEFRFQDKLGKQNYHEDTKKLVEPLTIKVVTKNRIKDTSEKLTKSITETFINNNKTIENINEKF